MDDVDTMDEVDNVDGGQGGRLPSEPAVSVLLKWDFRHLKAHLFTSWALNSAVECHLHTVEVIGSNPIAPTTFPIAKIAGIANFSVFL